MGPFRPKEGPFSQSEGSSGPSKGSSRLKKGLTDQNKAFVGQQWTLLDRKRIFPLLKGPFVGLKGLFVGLKDPFPCQGKDLSSHHKYLSGRKTAPETLQSRKSASQADERPPRPTQCPLRPMKGLFGSKDLHCKLTANYIHLTIDPLQSWGCTLCIVIALFEVGLARATTKVYRFSPLYLRDFCLSVHTLETPNLLKAARLNR